MPVSQAPSPVLHPAGRVDALDALLGAAVGVCACILVCTLDAAHFAHWVEVSKDLSPLALGGPVAPGPGALCRLTGRARGWIG